MAGVSDGVWIERVGRRSALRGKYVRVIALLETKGDNYYDCSHKKVPTSQRLETTPVS